MSEKLIEDLKTENLCTYFVLPLIKLNKDSFNKSNFIDCFITRDAKLIAVKVYSESLIARQVFTVPEYVGKAIREDGFVQLVYDIPFRWKRDVEKFIEGRFSRMSEDAKAFIRRYSGLRYKMPTNRGRMETDGRLLALDRDPVLRRMWEDYYSIELEEDMELMSIPGPGSFLESPQKKKAYL